jgi:hypothetical protein
MCDFIVLHYNGDSKTLICKWALKWMNVNLQDQYVWNLENNCCHHGIYCVDLHNDTARDKCGKLEHCGSWLKRPDRIDCMMNANIEQVPKRPPPLRPMPQMKTKKDNDN